MVTSLNPSLSRPRVGLIVNTLGEKDGMSISSMRHLRLLSEDIVVVPIALEESEQESEWHGKVEKKERFGNPAYRILAADFRVDRILSNTDIRQRTYADHIVRIAKREHLDAIHVYGAFEIRPLVSAFAAVRCNLPLIISFRGSDLEIRSFGKNLPHTQAALQAAKVCVCVNTAAQQLVKQLFAPTCPILVIHNHVNPTDFQLEVPLNLSVHPPIIGCVGEFRRVMGLDFLLQAFDQLATKREVSLLLVGPIRPIEAVYYNPLIDSLKNSLRLFRTGPVEHAHVLEYMKTCDILVFPSISDGSPNKVLEGMLAKRAIIAANVGGIPELIRDGIDGILVDPREQKQLLSTIELLLDDPSQRRCYGESAYARAISQFSPSCEREAWLKCYREAGLCL
ncbi:MAG: glycosyltransferase family 4 protein [Xenococcus sp. MO_188.B8]|nr:glycosyltransferase family 4 protein [Xenococcus sp. MO_188.B8]